MAIAIVAGRKTIGFPLILKLQELGHRVVCSFTRRGVWEETPGISNKVRTVDLTEPTPESLADALDLYCVPTTGSHGKLPKAEIMFIAIPSRGKGEEEMELIRYAFSRGLYVIIFAKAGFAYHYAELKPHRGRIGGNAVVGGRILALPWLRMNNLRGKRITIHGVINASDNKFMSECSDGSSMEEAFRSVKTAGLAEPGATDVVSFVNGEHRDKELKICATYNDALAPDDGPFITPDDLPPVVAVTAADLRRLTLPSNKFRSIVRITNDLELPLEFEVGSPGSMHGVFGGYQFSIGYYDLGRDVSLANWVRPGAWNGLRVQHDDGIEGPLFLGGLGAGPGPTIGAAMCDLNEYLRGEAHRGHVGSRERPHELVHSSLTTGLSNR